MKKIIRRLLKTIYLFIFKPFLKKGVIVDIGNAGRFRMDYAFLFSGFKKFGSRHNSGFQRWIESCRGKRVVMDIGAHIGLYSLPASRVLGSGGIVYAIEPSFANCSYLDKHKHFNAIDNVKVFSCLVGDGSGKDVEFYESKDADAMNSRILRKDPRLYKKVRRRQVSIDSFCREHGLIPEVIKIDVEGAEIDVLKGARDTLETKKPIIFLSAHPRILEFMNRSASELMDLIDTLGYDTYNASGERVESNKHNEYILMPKEESKR